MLSSSEPSHALVSVAEPMFSFLSLLHSSTSLYVHPHLPMGALPQEAEKTDLEKLVLFSA